MPPAAPARQNWVADHRHYALVSAVWMLAFALACIDARYLTLRTFDPSFKAKWLPVLVVAGFLVLRRFRLGSALLPQLNIGMILVLAWAMCSALWSPDPMFTLTQSIAIFGVSLIALAFALTAWTPDRFENGLVAVTTLLMVLSVLISVLAPGLGVHSESGISLENAWRGITYQKNALGQLATIGLIAWTYRLLTRRGRGLLNLAGMGLSVLLIVQSRSNTSLMLALLSCLLMAVILRPVLAVTTPFRRLAYGVMLVLIPIAAYLTVATTAFEQIGAFFGKDGSFSGRTQIWHGLFAEISRHPLHGLGFGSFWRGPDSLAGPLIRSVGWDVSTGHNGYIDVTNDLGIIGLALLCVFLALHVAALTQLARLSRSRFALHLALFMYLVLANFSESGWFRPITLLHVVGVYASVEVSRLLFERTLIRRRAATTVPPATARGWPARVPR